MGGNAPSPSIFLFFLATYLEVPNIIYNLEPLLPVLIFISPEVQSCSLLLDAAGYLSHQQDPSSSYPTGIFLQWQHAWTQELIILMVS